MDAIEHDDGIVFLHALKSGPANQSYGLQVAKLAGVPLSVITQAKNKLTQLENESLTGGIQQEQKPQSGQTNQRAQGDLFVLKAAPAIEYLKRLNPDEITAKEALSILYELKNKTAEWMRKYRKNLLECVPHNTWDR